MLVCEVVVLVELVAGFVVDEVVAMFEELELEPEEQVPAIGWHPVPQ